MPLMQLVKPTAEEVSYANSTVRIALDNLNATVGVDVAEYGAVYGDSSSTARSKNLQALADIQAAQSGDLNILVTGDLYLGLGQELPVRDLHITGKGSIFFEGGNYFILQNGGSSLIEFITLRATTNRTRLVMTPLNENTKIRYMVARYFDAYGTITIHRNRVDPTFPTDPLTFSYGVDLFVGHDFFIENASDLIFGIDDTPCKLASFYNFNMHNVAGSPFTFGTTNESPYEKSLTLAHQVVIFNNYRWVNDDTFFGDAGLGYHTLCVCESETVFNTNGYIKGLKTRVANGINVVYDFYYASERVFESNIVVEDCLAFNATAMYCLKFKSSRALQSFGRRWTYRRSYVAEILAANPGLGLTTVGVTCDFISVETQDWHDNTGQPLDWSAKYLVVDTATMESVVNFPSTVASLRPLFDASITNCHFSSFGTGFANFLRVALYPHNLYQRLRFSGNIIDCPSADIRALVNMQTGSGAGGGGFTGAIEIQNNNVRAASMNALICYTDNLSAYSNASVNINRNKFHALTGACRITPPDAQPTNYDEYWCCDNRLLGLTVSTGYTAQGSNYSESTNTITARSGSPTIFAVGSGAITQVRAGVYVLRVMGDAGVVNNLTFTLGYTAGVSTSIQFILAGGGSVTKVTGTDNGTYEMATSSEDGFNLQVVVSSTSIAIQCASSQVQRYQYSVYPKL